MLYFAYGSNLHPLRLRSADRAPSARLVGVGRLRGFTLRFHKRSFVDGTGKANIVEAGSLDLVWGALYRLGEDDQRRLDRTEGLGVGYDRRAVDVEVGAGPAAGRRRACAYVARPDAVDDALRPLCWYRDLVLAGAEFHRFPANVLERLRRLEVLRDADGERRRRALEPLTARRTVVSAGRD